MRAVRAVRARARRLSRPSRRSGPVRLSFFLDRAYIAPGRACQTREGGPASSRLLAAMPRVCVQLAVLASALALPSPLHPVRAGSQDARLTEPHRTSDIICTPEGANPHKYGPPPNPAIPCCTGLVETSEPLPAGFPGARPGSSSAVCRKLQHAHAHTASSSKNVQLIGMEKTAEMVVDSAPEVRLQGIHEAPPPQQQQAVKPPEPISNVVTEKQACAGGGQSTLPVWSGRGSATVWPPQCTPEGADKFQYEPPPHEGIRCCDGLVACAEPRPADYLGYDVEGSDVVFACRKPECCSAPRPWPPLVTEADVRLENTAAPVRPITGRCAMPPSFGPGASKVWPPKCTPEGADKFQYGPSPDPGIGCCEGLFACPEQRPVDHPLYGTPGHEQADRRPLEPRC